MHLWLLFYQHQRVSIFNFWLLFGTGDIAVRVREGKDRLLSMYCCWLPFMGGLFLLEKLSPCWKNSLKSGMQTDSYRFDGTFSRLGWASFSTSANTQQAQFRKEKTNKNHTFRFRLLNMNWYQLGHFWDYH